MGPLGPSRRPLDKLHLNDDSFSERPSCEDPGDGDGSVLRDVTHCFELFRTDAGAKFNNPIGPDAHCSRSTIAVIALAKPGSLAEYPPTKL